MVDPKAKYAGLLEKKWSSVIRLQKKVRENMRLRGRAERKLTVCSD